MDRLICLRKFSTRVAGRSICPCKSSVVLLGGVREWTGLAASNVRILLSILILLQALSLAAQVPGFHPKILGGEEVKQGEFPFVVRVRCTGSIIAPNWVLSAAHCFIDRNGRIADPSRYPVTLGRHRHNPVATRSVRRIVVHPGYDYTRNSGVKRDLALLQVFRPFPVSPVKLLKPDEEPPSGSAATSVGWGRLSDGTSPDVLQRVDYTFLSPEECNRTTPWGADTSASQPPGFWVDEGVLCIGNEHIALWDSPWHDTEPNRIRGGTAPGDSGGPVLVPIRGGWGQIGIHSGMGGVHHPALAERTSFSHEFITEHMSGDARLIFAHFANGAGASSELVLLNVAPHPIQPALYFFDRGGQPIAPESVLDVTGDLKVTGDGGLTIQAEMEPLEELTIATHGRGGELVSGSLQVFSDGAIGGVLRYRVPDIGVAGVGAGPAVRDALFPARRLQGGIRTAAVIHNLGEEALELRCRLMNGGVVLEETEIPLEANGQTSWFIEDEFPTTDTSDFMGSVRCTAPSEGLFTAAALEVDAGARIFTTLPVVPVDQTARRGRETVLDFAHFANGGGITSELVFVNRQTRLSGPGPTLFHPTLSASRPTLYFYDTWGNPIAAESIVDVTGDLEITGNGALTVRTEMEPLGVLTISTHGRGDLVSGSVRVVSEGSIGGMLRYRIPGVGVTGVGAGPPLRDALFPARRKEGGIRTAAALRNVGEKAIKLRCRLMSRGVVLEEADIRLEVNGQTSWFIEQKFPETDTTDFVGSVRCTDPRGGLFTAVALEVDAGNRIFTTLPVAEVE